jgi:hypothetical protein
MLKKISPKYTPQVAVKITLAEEQKLLQEFDYSW